MRWWNMEVANRAFDLVVKIGVILAAIAAINLLGTKPHLTTSITCKGAVDINMLRDRYPSRVPLWLTAQVDQINTDYYYPRCHNPELSTARTYFLGREVPGYHGKVGIFRVAKRRALARKVRSLLYDAESRSFVDAAAARGSFVLNKRSLGVRIFLRPAEWSAFAAARSLLVPVRIFNRGPGDTTNIRVEAASPRYVPIDDVSPFDLSSKESRTVTYTIRGGDVPFGASRPAFRAFGDNERTVNSTLLITVGAVLGALALVAFVNDIRKLRRTPAD